MLQVFKYLPPESCEDGFERIKHKLCFNVCLSLFTSMVFVISMDYIFSFTQMYYIHWIVWGVFGVLTALFKHHKINRLFTTVTLLTTGAVFLLIVITITNTIQSPIMPWFCIIPLYAFWLLNGKHALFWLLLSIAIYIFFLVLYFNGYKPNRNYDFFTESKGLYAVFGLVLLLFNVYIIGFDFEKKKKKP